MFAKEQVTAVNKEKTRKVYLPAGSQWVDFWTGESLNGGSTITSDAPIEKMPIYVKAGSIVPMGPFVQYATEKVADPIEVRVYPGADGNFSLYEDENDNYNYEKGVYANIPFHWNNKTKQLIIDQRVGSFPGMLAKRTFNVILVNKGTGAGIEISTKSSKTVTYNGDKQVVQL